MLPAERFSASPEYDDRSMSAPAAFGAAGRRCGSGAPPIRCCCRRSATLGCISRRDHLAAGPRPGRVRLPALDRADPRLARSRARCSSSRSPSGAARDHVAGERAADRQRRRLHPPRPRHRARRLVEHERLVDLRGDGRGRAALEVRDPRARAPRLQPVELRARPLLPPARRAAGRPARALVGADVALARARARADRRRRLPDPPPAAPAGDRRRRSGSPSRRGSACSLRAGTR